MLMIIIYDGNDNPLHELTFILILSGVKGSNQSSEMMHSGQGPTRRLHSVPLQLNTGTWESLINLSAAKIENIMKH